MAHGPRGLTVAIVLGLVGCTSTPKKTNSDLPKPIAVAPPKPALPAPTTVSPVTPASATTPASTTAPTANPGSTLSPTASAVPTGKNGSMNVPVMPTSGGTLRPTPIDAPALPTVPVNSSPPLPGLSGSALPPPPSLGMPSVDPKDISPPTPAKIDAPALPR
jgi:hypothetical protein